MIAFGCAMTDPEAYRRYAAPGIAASAEDDSEIYAFAAVGSICRSYNLVLDAAAARADLEALVLVRQDVEMTDPDVCAKVRASLHDPQVGAVGCIGATGVQTIAWWDGAVSSGPILHRYHEHGGGEMPGFSFTDATPAPAEVDTLGGFMLVLSPWTVRNVRFDETLNLGHGYDLDFCMQLRAAGRKVMTADLNIVYHHDLELVSDTEVWPEAHIIAGRKLDGRLPGDEAGNVTDWKARARKAEAECEFARTTAYSNASMLDASLTPLKRELDDLSHTLSWRLTAPLRQLNRWRSRGVRLRRPAA